MESGRQAEAADLFRRGCEALSSEQLAWTAATQLVTNALAAGAMHHGRSDTLSWWSGLRAHWLDAGAAESAACIARGDRFVAELPPDQ